MKSSLASTSRIELLSTVLETVAQPLYHVLTWCWQRDLNPHPEGLAPKASAYAVSPCQHEMVGDTRFELVETCVLGAV